MAFTSLKNWQKTCGIVSVTRTGILMCALSVLLVLSGASLVFAQDGVLQPVALTDTTDELLLAPHVLVQRDEDGSVTPQSIESSNGRILSGTVPKDDVINLGYDGKSHWLTIRAINSAREQDWVVDIGTRSEGRLGYIRSANAYEMTFTQDGRASVQEIGTLSNDGAFKFNIPTNTQKFLLLNIVPSAGKPSVIPLKIYSNPAFIAHSGSLLTPYAIYSFFLLAFAIYLFSSALSRGERSLFIFSAFFVYMLVVWTVTERMGSRIGFDVFDMLIPVMMLGYMLFSIMLTKHFFNIEQGSFTEKYILYGLTWLNIITTALSFLLPVSGGLTQFSLLYGAPFITFTILCLMAFAQSISRRPGYRLYFIGSVFPVAALLAIIASFLHILPQDPFVVNSLWYSVAFQGLFMIVANHLKYSSEEGAATEQRVEKGELDFSKLRETKDTADHSRLLKVIEKERELLAEFRARETERVNEMRQAKEAADEANRAKSAFLAVVSHEIRTPMTGVMGMVRMLLDSSITKQQRDYVLTIQESSEAMMALLNDILDFERIQRGKIELENISFDLHRLIQGVITLMSGHAVEKGISLSARMDDDLPKFVKGDPTRLRQVLLNLMGNAIKFTQHGEVTLLVKNMGQNDQNPKDDKFMIYFAIQDTGIGISAEAKKNLFTPFGQANSSINRKFGGTGLGLAISKGLIETMGSAININSKEGEGSTFFFTLEMERGLAASVSEKTVQTPQAPVSARIRILVVDDNAITRKVVIGFLEQNGHEILTASSAEEALAKINQDAFDLIFMDIELPSMPGNMATKQLREHRDRTKAAIPVIAMTGNIAKEDRERYLADGMSGFIAKPIEAEQLRNIVNEVARKSFEREIRMPETSAPDPFAMSAEDFAEQARKAEAANLDKNVFNPDMLQSLKDTIGAKQLGDLLTELIVKTEEILQAMQDASKQNDLVTLAARAHELKGMAGNFGLVEISSIAAQAERKAKNAETSDLGPLVGSLPDASMRAQNALKEWSAL